MRILFVTALIFASFNASSGYFAKPSEPHGVLKLHQSHPAKDIFPVKVYELNGKQITTRDSGMWLKPGEHEIKVSSVINLDQRDRSLTRLVKSNSFVNKSLKVNVKQGHIYYIGYDASDKDPDNWKPVVWKVKSR